MQALHVDYPMAETGQVLQDAHAATPCHAMRAHKARRMLCATWRADDGWCTGLLHCVEQAAQHTHRARVHSCAQAAVRGKRDDCMQLPSFPRRRDREPGGVHRQSGRAECSR